MKKSNYKQYLRTKYTDIIGDKGVVLTKNYRIPYAGTNNMNTIVISSVGTGKTRGFLKSNLLQKGCSFVITDTKGDLFEEFSYYLQSKTCEQDTPYVIKLLNLKDPYHSHHYNPFRYMHAEEDVVGFAQSLSANICKSSNDSFWLNASTNLLASLCFFIFETHKPQERNLQALLHIFNKYIKQKEEYSPRLDEQKTLYEEAIDCLPDDSLAKKFFLKVQCNPRTWDSIVVTVGQALSAFEYTKLKELTSTDDLDLEQIGFERVALFINLDDMNPCYDFIAGLLYTQIFSVLYKMADTCDKRCLPKHVRFFMDDFANYKIPNISHILSTCRSRGMSIEMILQSESQLKALYGDEYVNLIANSAYVYLGSNDLETQRNISLRLGASFEMVQNNVGRTYVFFPEGLTIKDTKADYFEHYLYSLLKPYSYKQTIVFNNTPQETLDLWSYEQTEKALGNHWIKNMDKDTVGLTTIHPRVDCFDSDEERMFYEWIIQSQAYQEKMFEVDVHKDLRDIFDISQLSNRKLRYKLMLMHCDFVFRKDNNIILAVEIDGCQHLIDSRQKDNDEIKDELFKNAKIPLIRKKAADVRLICSDICEEIIQNILVSQQLI